ncbi:MAG: SLC13 family permease, partial [Acidimicrobiales bacterium]
MATTLIPIRPDRQPSGRRPAPSTVLAAAVAGLGGAGAVTAAVWGPGPSRAAASQVWPPFVLVAGLLLVGLVAEGDGLFRFVGTRLARLAPNSPSLFAGSAVLVAVVTSVLNLDTSVVFLTPVLVHGARSRGYGEGPVLYGCLLLSNAGSLLLPGSNLTNLIVTGHHHVSGVVLLGRMAPVWAVAVVVTAAAVALGERRAFTAGSPVDAAPSPMTAGAGLVAVVAVTVLVLGTPDPALPVAAVGLAAAALRVATGRTRLRAVADVLGLPVLVGLFGVAVALGALGRVWDGPATLLSHLGAWGTAGVAAGTSVVVNNLPAASLLAARVPPRPSALLVGLDIGPNLLATGSLAWFLWWRTARAVGARPSLPRANLLGLLSAPAALAAAVGVFTDRVRAAFADAAREWARRLDEQAALQMRQAADWFRECLRTVPGDEDVAAADSLMARLAAFQAALESAEPPPGEAVIVMPAGGLDAAAEGCPVCQQMEQALTSHLFSGQFRLATREDEQERHSLGRGFCPLHTWQYASVGSPLGVSAGYARLAASVAAALESLARQHSTAADLARDVAALTTEPGRCPVCAALADAERTAIAGLISQVPVATAVLCLRHLALALSAGVEAGAARALLHALAGRLRRDSEDMRAFALKREAYRSGLVTAEES